MENILSRFLNVFYPWLVSHGLKILAILVTAYIIRRFGKIFIEKIVCRAVVADHFLTKEAEEKREKTLINIFDATIKTLVWVLAALMILGEVGVSIGPLLAGVGIVGLAFGFGGQYLIRDIISGLFIILENQFRVGDVVCLDGTCGLVEDINLRIIVLRDLDGTVHHVPNGEIKRASNLSKHFARVNLNIGVAYNSSLEKVIEVINRVGGELARDPQWQDLIIKPPQFLRVDDFADSAIVVKILGETKPLKQWDVAGELRKRLKIAFDKEGIEIPFPQRTVHLSQK